MGLYIGVKKGSTMTTTIKVGSQYDMRTSDGELAVKAGLVKAANAADTKKYYEAKQKEETK